MDGVLADFDREATYRIGSNIYEFEFKHGSQQFWERLNEGGDFFAKLHPMPDMPELWARVRHLNPAILTALPRDNGEEVARQKGAWAARYLGFHVQVITCLTSDKPLYCRPGDILIDDRNANEAAWIKAGGTFIHHKNAASTILWLNKLGVY
jgi:hypothetical protein